MNLLIPMSDQDRISLYQINTTSNRQVMRIKKNISVWIISWFNTKFLEQTFEWLSTTIRNILPMNGPAKSMCTLYHGSFCQSHGCKGAGWGLLRDFWQLSHFRTIVAISLSRLGHQTWSRASDFIRTIPGCPVCNSYSTRSRGWLRIITRISYNKQPSSTVISWRLLKKKSDPPIFYLGFLPSL